MNVTKKLVSTLAVGLSLAATARAQCEKAALTAFDGDIQEQLRALDFDRGSLRGVGAPFHPIDVEVRRGLRLRPLGTAWILDQKIEATDNDPHDWFGPRSARADSRLVVGAPEDDGNRHQCGRSVRLPSRPGRLGPGAEVGAVRPESEFV